MVSFALLVSGDEPTTFHGAITNQEKKEWMGAMVEEMEFLPKNQTSELVQLPEGKKTMGCNAVLALVASWDLHLEQMDVKITDLHEQPDGFTQPAHEHLSLDDGSSNFLLPYIDDMLIAAKNMYDVLALKALLSQEFDMKDLAKAVSTPLANHFKLFIEQCPKTDREVEDMAKVPYASAVGCLMYAMVCTRPNLAHVVSQVCKYMSKPGRHHWEAVKWIFRRSTTGYVFTLGRGSICWKSTVQSIVVLSTTEAEYMAVAEAAKEALWLSGLSKESRLKLWRRWNHFSRSQNKTNKF
ncbi:Retrovirus-related Pol polyprotein from transposon TNT 1-94 [Sesamum angolense]|uniref:Retrovirus-related Pol polyprotein from transposon TNT 1-94 n=1 Tax=Sesamum angolense TaxID=2727404 RepID=A0AAE2BM80_9LAMI|nr:Retrovirus-related Pol polyprotein from transposon TNT 1-94 [Sesamum angolense]